MQFIEQVIKFQYLFLL